MRKMSSHQIREAFLQFFQSKGHKIMPSASLIPEDPTILFTIAGMVPFKPIFLGQVKSPLKRATTSQKCLRTNDIENVGKTARHHTFFEMLGNFSFGDYFKKEAIMWGWEFFTEVIGFPKEDLYVSVYKDDDEAFNLWHGMIGLPENRIVKLGEEDNFWKVGPEGPCGPCSEIYIDLGPERASGKSGGVGEDERYLELWNLVFMQYNRNKDGSLDPLPSKNIDTGLGLERIASVLQKVSSDFETDLFYPIIQYTAQKAGISFGESQKNDIALKVISDHIRAMVFMISDGILPSNEGRGYVLRMLLRRAFRYGKLLNLNEPFLYDVAPQVVQIMPKAYPEVKERANTVYEIILTEEKRFQETLNLGLAILEEYIQKLKSGNQKILNGKDAFTLYDTYGFPLEITRDILSESGLSVDEQEYEKYMLKQKERSRQSWGLGKTDRNLLAKQEKLYRTIWSNSGDNKFCGYAQVSASTRIITLLNDSEQVEQLTTGEQGMIILEETPFYAEKGGQKGDTGTIMSADNSNSIACVYDTQMPLEGLIVHYVEVEKGTFRKDQMVKAQIDNQERIAIAANHTATHLLHYALREVLGSHVKQAGSSVTSERLRFDYSHYAPLKKEELDQIEKLVNQKVSENYPVTSEVTDFHAARQKGALALFGEKYGEKVRMIDIGGFCKELCGGTHLDQTSRIGIFKIVSEQGIGSGIRRIEAVTREKAWEGIKKDETMLQELQNILAVPQDRLFQKVQQLLVDNESLKREYHLLWKNTLPYRLEKIIQERKVVNGVTVVSAILDTPDKTELRLAGDLIKEKIHSGIIILATKLKEEKINLIIMISDDLINKGYDAVKIITPLAKDIHGQGGGKRHFAQAGGTDQAQLRAIFQNIEQYIQL
ncbi:MAG: alanine--tRNA ligase [Atribacterota bacterium]|nr:alanine--tRNA ligase [Atribacterota bacterium]MDD5637924.1 alanine--tRNA ligase [Atribacterota bacterium]